MKVLGNDPQSRRSACNAKSGGTTGTTVPRQQPAQYRVTNASSEEQSRGSLDTLRHIRSDTARNEGSEEVGQLDRVEEDSFGRNDGAHAARSARAALVDHAFAEVGLVMAGVVGINMPVLTRIGHVRMNIACRNVAAARMVGNMRVKVIVLAHTARDHGRRRDALQGQSDGQ